MWYRFWEDRVVLFWLAVAGCAVYAARMTVPASIESKHPGKRVLRVEFVATLPEAARTWKQIVARFEHKYPDVVVVRVDTSGTRRNILESAGMLPEVLSSNTFSLYRNHHTLLPLDAWVQRDNAVNLEDFYPTLIESCRYRQQLMVLPYSFNVSLLYYNVEMFREADVAMPDRSWDRQDYVAAARQLAAFDAEGRQLRWGTSLVTGWWVEWLSHVHMSGGEFISQDWRRCLMDSPEAIDGLRFYHDLVHRYRVAPAPHQQAPHPFLNRQTAMRYAGHTQDWVGLRSNADFEWDAALLPKGSAGRSGGERVAMGLGISRHTQQPELAWAFIEHFFAYENMAELIRCGYLPVQRSLAENEFLKRGSDGRYLTGPQHKHLVFEALEHCREQSRLPEFHLLAFYQAQPEIDSMLRGEISPEVCGQRIAEKVGAVLAALNRRNPELTTIADTPDIGGADAP